MLLTIINLTITWALVGLIWIVQLVHYPTFEYIAIEDFHQFHQHHSQSITLIVMPLMLAELGLAFWLASSYQFSLTYLIPLITVLFIWASTFFIQVPMHNQLGNGKDNSIILHLVQTNWIRTILWTFKGLWLLYVAIRPIQLLQQSS